MITYRGKKLEDCSREELVTCIEWLSERLEQEKRWHQEDVEMNREFAELTRRALNSNRFTYG
jgi:hypothetical protein